ncbi:MAG: MarR family transcriptional regulator [Thermomicrobiales bacterium]|nr:MarR family transcriptional regulator [Thermomicrobiales bacterium]
MTRAELVNEVERLFQEMSWRGRQHFAHRLESYGLTVVQYHALNMIGKRGPEVTMRDIAEALHLPASTLTSVVDRLVKDSLVERGALPSDRRAVVASLTEAGAEIVARVAAAQHADLETMLDGLSNDDLATFRRLLGWLLEGLDRTIAAASDAGSDIRVGPDVMSDAH